jgi:hypothetical protein
MSENITWIDESPLASVINIVSGNPFQGTLSPNQPTSGVSYDPLIHGGSTTFDGVDDVLNVAYDSDIDFGAGDFTIEFWLMANGIAGGNIGIFGASSLSSNTFHTYHSGTDVRFGTTSFFMSCGSLSTTAWNHFAISRNSGIIRTYKNGVFISSRVDSSSINVGAGGLFLGKLYSADSSRLNGNLGSIRFVKGSGLYPSGTTFTPQYVLDAVSGTVLLINHYNIGIFDHSSKVNLDASYSGTTRSSTQSKFGGTSVFCGGGGTYGELPSISGKLKNSFGAGDLTLEAFIFHTAASGGTHWKGIFHISSYASGLKLGMRNDRLSLDVNGVSNILVSSPLSIDVWSHVAVTRQSGIWRTFVNGVLVGTSSDQGSVDLSSAWFEIGGGSESYNVLGTYLDEIRFTRGIARYVNTFTPPTSPFPRA